MPRPLVRPPLPPDLHSQVSMRLILCGPSRRAEAHCSATCAIFRRRVEAFGDTTVYATARPPSGPDPLQPDLPSRMRPSYESLEREVFRPGMRLIKFAGSLVEVQHQDLLFCGSHRGSGGLGLPLLCAHPRGNPSPAGVPPGTLFTHSTVWKSVRPQIRCSETNVITLTSTSRFLPAVFLPPRVGMLCLRGGRKVRDNATLSDLVPGTWRRVLGEELKPW